MIAQFTGAALRAILVALLIATPSLLLPDVSPDTAHITTLFALFSAGLVFIEYNSAYPSIVEFRYAPPFNRLRFGALFLTVFILTAICMGKTEPTALTSLLTSLGTFLGDMIDFPYSPVRLMVLVLPENASLDLVAQVRMAAGVSYLGSITALAIYVMLVRILGWPTGTGAFNVWVNLPLFDPTAAGDVVERLYRDGRFNIALGFLMPFLIPAVITLAAELINPLPLHDPQTLIWTMSAWAFIPASLIMRGVAMMRVGSMISEKRRRAYAANGMQTA